ncbi:MAG: cryptochrome/photolyase family protein [Raineya sp.]|nr:cryptochrome/photolyase family protein [Raineya sp.]
MYRTLRLILGDQLNHQHSWLKQKNEEVLYVLMEIRQEMDYVTHHIQKILAFFAAMRNFAQELANAGHKVFYFTLDNPENKQDLCENLNFLIQKFGIQKFEYQLPDEYRLDKQLAEFCQKITIPTEVFDTEHFLSKRDEVSKHFGNKNYILESFYRQMRRKYNILMEGSQPLTGRWNYDAENRKKYNFQVPIPTEPFFANDVSHLVKLLQEQKIQTIGFLPPNSILNTPVSRQQALQLLEHFVTNLLPYFGSYEDAMHTQAPHLFHSQLSFVLNVKILHPLEVLNKAIEAWQENSKSISIAQIEGFVRQILGWREYMRGVYWAKMPEYAQNNFFEHTAPLPSWYWTAQTKMNCAKHVILQSLQESYAHHIQRLMVTGNIALLLGVSPDEVDKWYLGIYRDAIEWVEITNTRGMSQYADGGLVASKPYTASANYIDKMSNYCENCYYDKKKRHGEKACPLNSLYWEFHYRHKEKLIKNQRIGMVYQTLAKMDKTELQKILQQAEFYRKNAENL